MSRNSDSRPLSLNTSVKCFISEIICSTAILYILSYRSRQTQRTDVESDYIAAQFNVNVEHSATGIGFDEGKPYSQGTYER